jgi:arginine deiminase
MIQVSSEIGTLKRVIIHRPGKEIEQMTPETAGELLYDDILYLPSAQEQHKQFEQVLRKVSQVYEVRDLLKDILQEEEIKREIIYSLCEYFNSCELQDTFNEMAPLELATQLIEGTPKQIRTLSEFLSSQKFALPPLPNLFFTRDAAMVINTKVVIGNMATKIRALESMLMKFIFKYHPDLENPQYLFDATLDSTPRATFEGGDIQVLREDLVLIGTSERTSVEGIDYLIEKFRFGKKVKDVIVVDIPKKRSMIHLDMVFTMIDYDKCVVFPPLILKKHMVDVIRVDLRDPKVNRFSRYDYLLDALADVGMKLDPIFCGGSDELHQHREQWQSGANFVSFGPGKIIGYGMNVYTFEELNKAGIPRVEAEDVINGTVNISSMDKVAVAIPGTELNRGGGGARCMTMPIQREEL